MSVPRQVLFVALCAGCSAGAPAKAVSSERPTVQSASAGSELQCKPGEAYETLIVDWDPEIRGDLEVAMKEGTAVVSYDCKSFRLLGECEASGGYGYLGMTTKEKVVSMRDDDEVKANLPLSGIKFLAKIGGHLKRGTSLSAALAMVGKRSSSRKRLGSGELRGSCEGATHFVRSVTVGAIVVKTTNAATVAAAATFFGEQGASAASNSAEEIHQRDGNLEDCKKADPDGKSPPVGCAAPMRLVLIPLAAESGVAAGSATPSMEQRPVVVACPENMVRSDGLCAKPRQDDAHQCSPDNQAKCEEQCKAGDAASCMFAGAGQVAKGDRKGAKESYERACKGGEAQACLRMGIALRDGEWGKKDKERAAELFGVGCRELADAAACVERGILLMKKPGDEPSTLFRKACYGGEYEGCTWVGVLYQGGTGGVGKNFKLATSFFEKACKEGSMLGCHKLAVNLRGGKGTKKDEARANELYKQACAAGHADSCKRAR